MTRQAALGVVVKKVVIVVVGVMGNGAVLAVGCARVGENESAKCTMKSRNTLPQCTCSLTWAAAPSQPLILVS